MSKPFKKTIAFNFIIILAICIGIYFVFFSSLGWVTNHGKEVKVPDLVGKSYDEMRVILEKQGFDFDVDSSYNPDQPSLAVLDQLPKSGQTVKSGRTLFITINKAAPPQIPMPNLINLSYRSAVMLLQSNKLILGDTTHTPDIAEGAVLEQKYNGKVIDAGQMIAQGSKIDLVVANSYGEFQIEVPDIIGLSYPEAVAILSGSNLNFVAVFDGAIVDSSTAIVYAQTPQALGESGEKNQVSAGESVDFRVRQYSAED